MESKNKTQRTVPIVAIRGSVIFPHVDSFLTFGRKKSLKAINSSFQNDRMVAIFTQKDSRTKDPNKEDLHNIGIIAIVSQMMSSENEVHALVKGQARVRLDEITSSSPHLLGKVTEIPETDINSSENLVLTKKLVELFRKAVNLGKGIDVTTIMKILSQETDPASLVDSVSSLLDIKNSQKQLLLEESSVEKRLKKVLEYLTREVSLLDLEQTISQKTQERFEDQMRKAMLREKKRTIEAELGEDEEASSEDEISEYRKKIKKSKMPKEVNKKAKKELSRLEKMSPHNPESGYIRNYLDWLIDMPWSTSSETNLSIKKATQTLNIDHYGLDKAKERILEYLSVFKLKQEKKGNKKDSYFPTILCFIGPPGVGKTSIGRSIAKAMGRKFVRVSLGGIRDEAEIRGHRRTYVGALPGRIIQGIKNAGTNNPVFMLDEIDKLGADFRGDPASALLEILDPEQNKEYSDHYLEVPFDLSQVTFILTANVIDTIPHPLRDRMEIINFSGYVEDEKYFIAKKYLWPKQLKINGLEDKKITLTKEAFFEVIQKYTREAGVRELERSLATICRKITRQIAEKKHYSKTIKVSDIKKFLGPQRYSSLIAEKKNEVGMSTGLGVTSAGGEIMFVEVALMPGKGKLTLTGQLGDVMKESVKAAFTWTKSHWHLLGLSEGFGQEIDVHVHVPEGAIPKDGPSAGVAMTTALVSALTQIPVRRDVGMTGEVTLRGRVLEIGGVKEKVVAAHTAGLKTVILPKDNKKDLEDIPKNVKKDIKFIFAEKVEDVLKTTLTKWPIQKPRRNQKKEPEAIFHFAPSS